jgi:hypothetical protein
MTIPQSVAEILKEHVTLEVEGIDRMYLNVYVPRLQIVEGVLGFIRRHRGYPVASTRMVEPITRQFVAAIEKFVRDHGIPLVSFDKGQRKEHIAAAYRAAIALTAGQMTYHLRRLRLHQIIERISGTHRYRLTNSGLRIALFFTRIYNRLLRPGLGRIVPEFSKRSCPLRRAFDKLDQQVTTWAQQA